MRLLSYIKDRLQGKAPKGARRSKHWRKVRKAYIKAYPFCAVCGTTKKLEVHHIYPFHLFPELELKEDNLITLCDGGGKAGMKSCHLFFGHYGTWFDANLRVREDSEVWIVTGKQWKGYI